jgi:hypothetical protein
MVVIKNKDLKVFFLLSCRMYAAYAHMQITILLYKPHHAPPPR